MYKSQIQPQFQGYQQTPLLWRDTGPMELTQFAWEQSKTSSFNEPITQNLRLGKLVERFALFEFKQDLGLGILLENYQVQDDKLTLGELDAIIKQGNQTIHLEIVYKFYLYDPAMGTTFIDHWIGPNRRDSLIQKLTKLKEKQLPLLYHPLTEQQLAHKQIQLKNIIQRVWFKAQLFLPYGTRDFDFKDLNPDCLAGYYLNYELLEMFKDCKFYIPRKHDWLVVPHTQVDWLPYTAFLPKIEHFLGEQSAPLCWVKHPNGLIDKVFVVWWN